MWTPWAAILLLKGGVGGETKQSIVCLQSLSINSVLKEFMATSPSLTQLLRAWPFKKIQCVYITVSSLHGPFFLPNWPSLKSQQSSHHLAFSAQRKWSKRTTPPKRGASQGRQEHSACLGYFSLAYKCPQRHCNLSWETVKSRKN